MNEPAPQFGRDTLITPLIIMINNGVPVSTFIDVGAADGTFGLTVLDAVNLLGERMGRAISFLSITLQPRKDTPKILTEYADNFDVKPGWSFLTGKPADVEQLRRALGYVDSDPERDKDLSNHVGMARYGNDRLNRWGGVSLRSSAENIASTFKWLSQV